MIRNLFRRYRYKGARRAEMMSDPWAGHPLFPSYDWIVA